MEPTFSGRGSRRFGAFNNGRAAPLKLFLFMLSSLPGKRDTRSQRFLAAAIGSFNVWKAQQPGSRTNNLLTRILEPKKESELGGVGSKGYEKHGV